MSLRTGICESWRELRAIEEQVESFRVAFDGEDVLTRAWARDSRPANAALVALHGKLRDYTGPFEPPAPDEDVLALIQSTAADVWRSPIPR